MGDAERVVVRPSKASQQQCCWSCWLKKDSCNGEGSSSFTPEQLRKSQVERYLKTFPVGLTFQPTDEEAVLFFLTKRDRLAPLPPNPIQEVDMYKSTPEDLLDKYREHMVRGKALYVFTSRDKKYENGHRPKRYITGRYEGYWKISGRPSPIKNKGGVHVGTKRAVNFYKLTTKHKKGEKTAFKMHEYVLEAEIDNSESVQGGGKKQKQKLKPVKLALCKIWKHEKKNSSPVPESPTDTGHANISSPVQEALLENTDTALLGHARETDSLGSSSMDMAVNDANFSCSSGFSLDMFTTTLFDDTFADFTDFGDNYSWGENQTEELQVPLNQENQYRPSAMSDYLPGLDISGSSFYGFDDFRDSKQ